MKVHNVQYAMEKTESTSGKHLQFLLSTPVSAVLNFTCVSGL